MNQPIKFPDIRPPKGRTASVKLPTPSGYAQRVPLFPTSDGTIKNRRIERKRLMLLFGAAVALHAALLLGLWLMPPLRLKWGPPSDAWVQVKSLPKKEPESPIHDAPKPLRPAESKPLTALPDQEALMRGTRGMRETSASRTDGRR